jgi:hypothetical protein
MQPTTDASAQEDFIEEMTQRMADLARRLGEWVQAQPRTLEEMEHQTVALVKDLGTALLSGACQLAAAAPAPRLACPCGQRLLTPRRRPASVLTVLGSISVTRPYYHCPQCHQGGAPFDQQIGLCAGSTSAGLDELLALLGARQDSFEEAVAVLDKLTLVRVCPNLARDATERLGRVLLQDEQQAVATAWAGHPAAATSPAPPRLYVTMDGVMVHTHAGWKEYKLGAVYSTITQVSRKRPDTLVVRAQNISFVGDLVDAATFGPQLWCEAARRGVQAADEVIVLGDGAHWIWNLAAEHFPEALQIVDWYHAAQYIWNVAQAVYGEGTDLATAWAKTRLDDLWDGKVDAVLAAFQAQAQAGKVVQEALTYYRTNQTRMHYPEYRAQGIQIGSGSIESGCHHVIGARLKQAGMIWNVDGAREVATVRTWLKSRRWDEAMALRPGRARSYQRRAA